MNDQRRRCNSFTTRFAGVGMLCWGDPGHAGDHHSRHRDYTWPDPPERLERRSRLSWRRREWTRQRVAHPINASCWMWAYADDRGRLVDAERLVTR